MVFVSLFFYFDTLVKTFLPMNFMLVVIYVYKNLLVLKDYHEDCVSWITLLSPSAHTVNIYVLYITYHLLPCTIVICMCFTLQPYRILESNNMHIGVFFSFFLCQIMVCHMQTMHCENLQRDIYTVYLLHNFSQ